MALQLDKILKDRKIGITELARRMNVDRQTIYYYIKQDSKNPLEKLEEIADAIGISINELLGYSNFSAFIKSEGEVYNASSLNELSDIVEKLKNPY